MAVCWYQKYACKIGSSETGRRRETAGGAICLDTPPVQQKSHLPSPPPILLLCFFYSLSCLRVVPATRLYRSQYLCQPHGARRLLPPGPKAPSCSRSRLAALSAQLGSLPTAKITGTKTFWASVRGGFPNGLSEAAQLCPRQPQELIIIKDDKHAAGLPERGDRDQ